MKRVLLPKINNHLIYLCTLEYFHQTGRTQSILSASKSIYLNQAVEDSGIRKYFNAIIGLDNHHAAGKLSLARSYLNNSGLDASEMMLIGDTSHDAEIAKEIGVKFILIPNGHQSRTRLAESGGILTDSLTKLQDLFQDLII